MQRMSALFSLLLLTVALTMATAHAQQSPTQQAAQAAAQVPEQQLQRYVDASREIAELSETYTQRIREAQDEAERQQIRDEANRAMVDVVRATGLDVDSYNALGQAIQQNPILMERAQALAQPN